jgi:hypothetical protein
VVIEEKNFDVRIHLYGLGNLSPGQTVMVPISFLDWKSASEFCSVGTRFLIREMNLIGEGIDSLMKSSEIPSVPT